MESPAVAVPTVDRKGTLAAAEAALINGSSSSLRTPYRDVIVRTEGAYVWNADGRRYIDNHCGFGAISIGHSDPRVNQAVAKIVATSDLSGIGPQPGEIELAERIIAAMPSAEKVGFCTSGTDATLHAVHFARAATGRRTLLKFHGSYHGWHDHVAVGSRFTPGQTPKGGLAEPNSGGLIVEHVDVIPWNDLDALEDAFVRGREELAAVICEPYSHSYGCIPTKDGYLERLRALCDEHGVALIFDEVKTGFRYHPGGYQAICGVTPDITAFAKALGNGYTVGGMACTDAIVDLLTASVGPSFSGTFNASPYALAAALVTTEILEDGGYEHTASLGERIRKGLRAGIDELGLDAWVTGLGGSWSLYFGERRPENYAEAIACDSVRLHAYLDHLTAAGIFNTPVALAGTDMRICVATSEDDVEQMLCVAHEALSEIARAGAGS